MYELRFTKPDGFTFKAGQFVLFEVPLIESPSDIQPRAYSLSSTALEPDLLFVIHLTPGGRMSRYVAEVLKEGMSMTIKGPFGFFTLRSDTPKDIVFIATGAGIAPFRSQVLDALAANDQRRMDVIYGVRGESDLFWHDEFLRIAEEHHNVHLHLTLTSPSSDWAHHTGRVQVIAEKVVEDFSSKTLYVCGNPDMTKEVKELALGKWGMKKEDVHVEGYI
jgi:ferredoxin-NADP reductase